MDLDQVIDRKTPEPFAGDYKIPWHDPDFSARMLREHLSQDHDRASRRRSVVDAQVDWLHRDVLEGSSARILDLGCGPGLYCAALGKLGHRCVGIDFSPASIEFARAQDPSTQYRLADLRSADFATGFDLALLLYGEFNAFAPNEASDILNRARDAVFPGGSVVLEVHTERHVMNRGQEPPGWFSSKKSVFSDAPHVCLVEHFWHTHARAATTRYFVLEEMREEMREAAGRIRTYTSTAKAYSDHEYIELLQNAGFRRIGRFPSLAGDPSLFFLVAST